MNLNEFVEKCLWDLDGPYTKYIVTYIDGSSSTFSFKEGTPIEEIKYILFASTIKYIKERNI